MSELAENVGNFIRLEDGKVFYKFDGNKNGDLIVLIHDNSCFSFVWEEMSEILASRGFYVLRYDIYGRGLSDRASKHTGDLYDRQLENLLDALELGKRKINIVGCSIGALIGTKFAEKFPDRLSKIGLISPVMSVKNGNAMLKLSSLLVNIRKFEKSMDRHSLMRTKDNFFNKELVGDFNDKFALQLEEKGYTKALVQTINNYDFPLANDHYRNLGKMNIPVLLIWGKEDEIIHYECNEKIKEFIPDVNLATIEEAGHLSFYEKPEEVANLIDKFIKGV